MALSRTYYNTLVDDTGVGDGTPVDKAMIDAIYDDVDNVLDAIDDNGALSFAASTELTIASDAVTLTAGKNVYSIDTEANAASDNLATITLDSSGREARFLILKAENVARVVTVKHGTGNIHLKGGDFAMSDADHRLMLYRDGTTWYELARSSAAAAGGGTVDPATNGFRLTLTTNVPVTDSDVTGAGTLYLTPFKGNAIALYDGAAWNVRQAAQQSLALTLTSGKPYDVFVYDSSGTPTLEVLVWTNDTTRATALVLQDGVLVKSGATTRRYVGSLYASGTNTTEDSAAKRYLFNYYHQAPRHLRRIDTTDSWTYTTATWRQANNSTANQVEIMNGYIVGSVDVMLFTYVSNSSGNVNLYCGIGEDTVSAPTGTGSTQVGNQVAKSAASPATQLLQAISRLHKTPAVGRHYYAALENSGAVGTTTWYGDNGGELGSGLVGMWHC